MRNRFIYSVKGYGRAVTEGEDPPRKKSFAEYFVNALFTIDEEERNKSNEEFPSATKGLKEMCLLAPKHQLRMMTKC